MTPCLTYSYLSMSGSLDVQLRSEGCNDPNKQGPNCGWAFIKVNGVDRSLHRRGHNVVVLDAKTGWCVLKSSPVKFS